MVGSDQNTQLEFGSAQVTNTLFHIPAHIDTQAPRSSSPIVTTTRPGLRLGTDRVVTAKGLTMGTSVLSLRDEST